MGPPKGTPNPRKPPYTFGKLLKARDEIEAQESDVPWFSDVHHTCLEGLAWNVLSLGLRV